MSALFILSSFSDSKAQCYNTGGGGGWGGGVNYGGGFNTCTSGTVQVSSTQYQQFDGIAGYTYNFQVTGGWAGSGTYWTYYEYRSSVWTAIYSGNGQTANFTCQQTSPGGGGWNIIVFYNSAGCPSWPGTSATMAYKVTSYTAPSITAPAGITTYNSPANSCGASQVFGAASGSPGCSGTSWSQGFNIAGGPLSSLSGNLKLWCKGDEGIALDVNNNVANWHDMSGTGNRFTQFSQGNRPTYTSSSATFNGNPCITFNTSQYLTLLNSLDNNANSTYTIFVVDRTTGTNSRLCSSANQNWLFGHWGGAQEKAHFNGWISGSSNVSPAPDQLPHMFEATSNGVATNGTNFYDYGVLQNTGTPGSPNGPSQLQLNGWNNGLNEMSSGEVAEVIYFNTILSTAQRQIIEGYLAYKYNLPCPLASTMAYQRFTATTTYSFAAADAGGKSAAATSTASITSYPGPAATLTSSQNVCVGGTANLSVVGAIAPAGQCLTTGTNTGNYLNVGTSATTSNVTIGSTWTIGAWVKFPLPANGNWNTLFRGINYHPVIVQRTQGATNAGLILGAYQGGFYPATSASVFNGATIAGTGLTQGVDISALSTGWHHIAVTGSGNTESFYIDGAFVGKAGIQVGYSGTDNLIAIGNYQGGGQDAGTMDEVKIYNVALAQNTISNMMTQVSNSSSDANWNNLVAYYKMDASPVPNSATGTAACSSCQGTIAGSATAGSSATGYYSYVWSGSGSPTFTPAATTTSETVTVTGVTTGNAGSFSVYATANSCNSQSTSSAAISVFTPSTAVTGISGTNLLCNGTGTTLTATGGTLGTGANYQWGTGNVVGTSPIGGATSASYSVTPSSTTSYWVSITGPAACGGAGGVAQTVTVNTPSTAVTGITGTVTVCQGTGTTLTASGGSLGTGATYQWGTGNVVGTSPIGGATSASYSVTPSGTTSYWVSVTGLAPCGGAGGVAQSVTVNPIPTPTFTTVPTSPQCSYTTVTYTTQAGNTNYIWSGFGTAGVDYNIISGGIGTSSNTVTLEWISEGTKLVRVTYTSLGCPAFTQASSSIVVNAKPTSAVLSDAVDGCNGGHQATVTITGGTAPYAYTVCGTAYTGQPAVASRDAGTSTSCTLTLVTDANGCAPISITGTPYTYTARTLTAGGTTACMVNTSATKIFYDNSGNLMVKLTDGGATLGNTTVVATVDGSVQSYGPVHTQSYLQRHFKISPTNQSGAASVCLYLSDAEVTALNAASAANDNHGFPSYYPTFQTTLSNAVVTKFHGAGETPLSNTSRQVLTPASKTHNPTVNGVTYNNVWEVCMNVTTWSGFYIHGQNVNNTALPVTMLYLTADAIDNKYIQLDWATASEINNTGFQVERSTDGANFASIGWVAGHGTTNEMNTYQYEDRTAQPATVYYYRLKQIDTDGQSEYTETVSASLIGDKGFTFEDLIPNPATDHVQLGILTTSGQKATVTITDILGRVVTEQPWQLSEGYNTSSYDVSTLAGGTYTVTVYTATTHTAKRLVVTR